MEQSCIVVDWTFDSTLMTCPAFPQLIKGQFLIEKGAFWELPTTIPAFFPSLFSKVQVLMSIVGVTEGLLAIDGHSKSVSIKIARLPTSDLFLMNSQLLIMQLW